MAETVTLIKKLSKAMADVKGVSKDGENKFQRYDYQTEAAIKRAVKSAIQAQGIVIIPSYEIVNQVDKTAQKGNINHFADVMGTFTITDGNESIIGTMPGSGQDTGEKAIAKACTSSQKYFYKQLFNISDKDEDPDGDDSGSYTSSANTGRQSQRKAATAKSKPKGNGSSDDLLASSAAITEQLKRIDTLAKLINKPVDKMEEYLFGLASLKVADKDKMTLMQVTKLASTITAFYESHKKG